MAKPVTKEEYDYIKPHVVYPINDNKNIKRFHRSQTTLRSIRNTKDYQEYCERVFRFHGYPNGKKSAAKPNTQSKAVTTAKAAEDRATKAPITEIISYKPDDIDNMLEFEEAQRSMRALTIVMLAACVLLTAIIVVVILGVMKWLHP